MNQTIRTRFAPSPTGFLHVGGLRTALFKYLFAKKHGGAFILRIDDTDRERFVEEATDHILESLKWLGLEWDEGPVVGGPYAPYEQSKRFDLYQDYARKLQASAALYPCWCSPQRLQELRERAASNKKAYKYDRYCLDNPQDLHKPHVLRFRIPETPKAVGWDDAVRGRVEVKAEDLDDFVAVKSDGWPTYHFSSIVDDETMKITHVIRGDEWVASTPKHLLVYAAFNWQPPVYAHVPTILGPDGKHKLSKRDNAKSALEYRDLGYLPEALINYLASLGFNDGSTKEIYSREELIEAFSLDKIAKSGAVFDEKRLLWMNGHYIRGLDLEALYENVDGFWPEASKVYGEAYKKEVLGLVQERLKYFSELPELTGFFFEDLPLNPELITTHKQLKKYDPAQLKEYLQLVLASLSESSFELDDLSARLNNLLEQTSEKPAVLFSLIRIATSQAPASPPLAETISVLSKDVTLRRLANQISAL